MISVMDVEEELSEVVQSIVADLRAVAERLDQLEQRMDEVQAHFEHRFDELMEKLSQLRHG
jgi:hypothetical protein